MEPVPQTGIHVVGREAELAVLREFLAPEGVSGPLVIPGDPGIGKTTPWEAGLAAADEAGCRVLSARASEPEVQLSSWRWPTSFKRSSRRRWRRCLGRSSARWRLRCCARTPVTRHRIGSPSRLGSRPTLRILADEQPLLVAVDDVPWLRAASRRAANVNTSAEERSIDEPVDVRMSVGGSREGAPESRSGVAIRVPRPDGGGAGDLREAPGDGGRAERRPLGLHALASARRAGGPRREHSGGVSASRRDRLASRSSVGCAQLSGASRTAVCCSDGCSGRGGAAGHAADREQDGAHRLGDGARPARAWDGRTVLRTTPSGR